MKSIVLPIFLMLSTIVLAQEKDTVFVHKLHKNEVSFVNEDYSLFFNKADKKQLKLSKNKTRPVIISYNIETYQIDSVKVLETQLTDTLRQLYRILNDPQIDTSMVVTNLKEEVSDTEVQSILNYMQSLDCRAGASCKIDEVQCIPFHFKRNGCQARAHWMSALIETRFNSRTRKIFVFGRLRAKNDVTCSKDCVMWGWHVAVLLKKRSLTGELKDIVIDPSLSRMALTIDEWKSLQNNCSTGAKIKATDIVDSKYYSWNKKGGRRTYYTDPKYSRTLYNVKKFCKKCDR